MRWQDHVVRQTQKAVADFIRTVEAVPEEKLDWKPSESARSIRSQAQEVCVFPGFPIALIQHGVPSAMELVQQLMDESQASTEISTLLEHLRSGTADLCAAISAFPDSRLDEEISLNFGAQSQWTMADVLGMHYWNTTYHIGQINYLQTIWGDRTMH